MLEMYAAEEQREYGVEESGRSKYFILPQNPGYTCSKMWATKYIRWVKPQFEFNWND
jgi:hypothetical protein